jgi:hypothetical protein
MRLLIDATGQEIVKGSPWVGVNKQVFSVFAVAPERIEMSQWLRRAV